MRVLVVEDKRSLAGHIGRALEGEGHTVTLAFDERLHSSLVRQTTSTYCCSTLCFRAWMASQ